MEEQKSHPATPSAMRSRLAVAAVAVLLLGGGGFGIYWEVLRPNFHAIVPGQAYRSGQPRGDELTRWIRQYGLKTVVNLRGESNQPLVAAELEAVKAAGADFVCIGMSARSLPSAEKLRRLVTTVEGARRPVLFHCLGGADRSGLASVLAAMAIGGKDFEAARSEMSWHYLHFDSDPKHIAGVLEMYEDHCRQKGTGTGGWDQFRIWAMSEYNEQADQGPKAGE